MTEFEFSKEVIEEWENGTDFIMNIIVKKVDEYDIEMENINLYLIPKVVNILEKESKELHLLIKEKNPTFDIF